MANSIAGVAFLKALDKLNPGLDDLLSALKQVRRRIGNAEDAACILICHEPKQRSRRFREAPKAFPAMGGIAPWSAVFVGRNPPRPSCESFATSLRLMLLWNEIRSYKTKSATAPKVS